MVVVNVAGNTRLPSDFACISHRASCRAIVPLSQFGSPPQPVNRPLGLVEHALLKQLRPFGRQLTGSPSRV